MNSLNSTMPPAGSAIRLNKFLAEHLGVSRRQADDLIAGGKVLVNDQIAELGRHIFPDDRVVCDGRPVAAALEYIYLALHKPVGYVCSRRQQGESPTIYSILPDHYQSLKTVGRLDRDSSGLILLTNDGDFAFKMTHPSFRKTKIYEVTLDHALAPLHRQMIADFGIEIGDGISKLGLVRLRDGDDIHWRVEMGEGRNRQIRRTFAALGYEVTALHRIQFGPYQLDNLPSGQFVKVAKI